MHTLDLDVGVPARGWHGEAYRGHIFWDELFVFPLLNLRLHEITRTLLGRLHLHIRYRFHSLEVEITPKKLKIEALESPAGPIQVSIKGQVFELKMGETQEVDLT
jgi:trehalose/maltose hydrolase-like predicted phosphorylase